LWINFPLAWPGEMIRRHDHHHHRFDAEPIGPGAEVEASRGCPYHCTFCAKENFRNKYRRRPANLVLQEIDALARQGVEYIYFIDEIFLPHEELLRGLLGRGVKFGVQTRIDVWKLKRWNCSVVPAASRLNAAWKASPSKAATCSPNIAA